MFIGFIPVFADVISVFYNFQSGRLRKNHPMIDTTTNNECLIEVQDVSKKFSRDMKWSMLHGMADIGRLMTGQKLRKSLLRKQEFWAVKDVSLKLHRGQIMSVLGNNGSGKTTLM